MIDVLNKYKKGKEVRIGLNRAIISSDLMKFKEFFAIYADITENINFNKPCGTYKIHNDIALIIRDKELMSAIRFNYRRKKSYILS